MVPLENDGAAVPLLAESYAERDARFSPDGHWVAYVAEESGHPEASCATCSMCRAAW